MLLKPRAGHIAEKGVVLRAVMRGGVLEEVIHWICLSVDPRAGLVIRDPSPFPMPLRCTFYLPSPL